MDNPIVAQNAGENPNDLMLAKVQQQFRDYAAGNLPIEEAQYIVVDEQGQAEYRCLQESDAMDLAQKRVSRVGGCHSVFKRVANVRPPKPQIEIEKAPE